MHGDKKRAEIISALLNILNGIYFINMQTMDIPSCAH